MAEYTYNEDIDALAAFLLRVRDGDDPWADPDHAKDWSRALTALVAERDAAIKERDEARRWFCFEARRASDGKNSETYAKQIADMFFWDCFAKEGGGA